MKTRFRKTIDTILDENSTTARLFQFAAVFLALVISVYSCNISRQANEIAQKTASAQPVLLESYTTHSTNESYRDFYLQDCTSILFLKNEGGLDATITEVILSSKAKDGNQYWNSGDSSSSWTLNSTLGKPIGAQPVLYFSPNDSENAVFGIQILTSTASG